MAPKELVELFHLLFLRVLLSRGWTGRHEYALKGGANLRFFFDSPRYSEDIDLNTFIQPSTVCRQVEAALASPTLIKRFSKLDTDMQINLTKDTDTSQKWKITFMRGEPPEAFANTKIEISHRDTLEPTTILSDAPSRELLQKYNVVAVHVPRYDAATALYQKTNALATRREAQARDVFDINWLLTANAQLNKSIKHLKDRAIKALLDLDYRDYLSQVVAYLEPGEQNTFDSEHVWDEMVRNVYEYVESAL